MLVRDALDRLDQIHDQLTRAEVYRGFRVPAVAAVGVIGLAAAAAQPLVPGAAAGLGFVWYWAAVAGACGTIGSAAAVHAYATREDGFGRRRARRVMAQFAPCLLAGAAVTLGAARAPELVPLLPGLWAVAFGLGLVAARPYLPDGIGPVGVGYVAAGAYHLLRVVPDSPPDGWAVGGVFGVGHLVTAVVLWAGAEEDGDG